MRDALARVQKQALRWGMVIGLLLGSASRAGDAGAQRPAPEAARPPAPRVEPLVPFPDEVKAMRELRESPTDEARRKLARIRLDHAVALAEEAERGQGRPDGMLWALDYAQSATELDPEAAPYWMFAGYLYSRGAGAGGMDALAEQALTRALALDPTLASAHLILGQVHLRLKRYDLAIADLESALAFDTALAQPAVVSSLGWAYVWAGQVERGERFFRTLGEKGGDRGAAGIALAGFLAGQKRNEEAARALQAVADDKQAARENREYARRLMKEWRLEGKP